MRKRRGHVQVEALGGGGLAAGRGVDESLVHAVRLGGCLAEHRVALEPEEPAADAVHHGVAGGEPEEEGHVHVLVLGVHDALHGVDRDVNRDAHEGRDAEKRDEHLEPQPRVHADDAAVLLLDALGVHVAKVREHVHAHGRGIAEEREAVARERADNLGGHEAREQHGRGAQDVMVREPLDVHHGGVPARRQGFLAVRRGLALGLLVPCRCVLGRRHVCCGSVRGARVPDGLGRDARRAVHAR
mmetsp:Transcript_1928/g.6659  ORF Transcript_1928/g.6659 Transcript_1928/m.6659 type:complete len:243 (+) Transcript_1928:344-1072(+)